MKKITVKYETYKFNELTDEAKQCATTDLLMSIDEAVAEIIKNKK